MDLATKTEVAARLYISVTEVYKAKLLVENDQREYAMAGRLRQNWQLPSWPDYERAINHQSAIESEIIEQYISENPVNK